jgi:hypothetical protein
MDILNNREWALVIWIFASILFVLISPKMDQVRESFLELINNIFVRAIVAPLVLMLIYIAIMVFGLAKLGLWEIPQLKNTIIWTTSVAILSLFRLESAKADPNFLKNLVLDNLKLIAIIQFVVGFYVSGLVIELMLVPIMAISSAMVAVSERDKKYHLVGKIFNGFLVALGTILIARTLYMLATNFGDFAKIQTVYDFSVPPLLTCLYLPFIFFMMVFTTYELVDTKLRCLIKNPSVRSYAKMYSMFNFHLNIKMIERWASSLPFQDTSSKEGIKKSVKQVFKLVSVEKNPPKVLSGEGWSPYEAKNFLLSEDIKTGYYHSITPDEWFASSTLIEIGDDLLPNNISYYVEGDETTAKCLKLILNVNQREDAEIAHVKLLSSVKVLLKAALGMDATSEIEAAIISGKNKKLNHGSFVFAVEKNVWPLNSIGGYDIKVTISSI